MSASNNNEILIDAVVVVTKKEKKPTLNAQNTKFMVFGNWLIERLVAGGLMNAESVNESRKILGMWSSVEDQIALYDGFAADLKTNTKEMKLTIRQFLKPPKATKKAKTAASEGEKKRGRKKKEVAEEQDPILALNDRLVAAAQSDEPIVAVPEYVRATKAPEPEAETPAAEIVKPNATEPVKNKAEEKVTKEAAKAEEKATKEAAKAAEKAAKETAKAEEKAAKAEEKAAKEAAKAEEKAAKETAKAEEKAAKETAKPAKAKAKAKAVALPIPLLVRNSPPALADDEEEEEEELECEVFKLDGVEYLIDSDNTLYDRNTQDIIGKYDSATKTIH